MAYLDYTLGLPLYIIIYIHEYEYPTLNDKTILVLNFHT
jgi:hypothetical protein